jgi:hypothetical protein
MPNDVKYDSVEALSLLGAKCEELAPDIAGAADAARALHDQIAKLGAEVPNNALEIKYDVNLGVAFRTKVPRGQPAVALHLQHEHGGPDLRIVDYPSAASVKITGLRFDPVGRRLEGITEDTSIVPVPGQPRPKRSAMAVVLEQLLAKLSTKIAARANGEDWNIKTA